jgi:Holliday junction resolvase RusA-like endonuclease
MQKISVTLQDKCSNSKFLIEDRRRTVARLLAQSMTETEIAIRLDVHVSTICRDIKALKAKSQQFVYDLAKSDLAYYYKQCIEGIDEANRESWKIYHDDNKLPIKEKLLALKVIIQSNESKFKLLSEGPIVLAVKSLEERLEKIESREVNQ